MMASQNDIMENIYQCPVCATLPSCHIYQCNNGHLVCRECYNKMTSRPILCAVCRDPMPRAPIRVRSAEQVRMRPIP